MTVLNSKMTILNLSFHLYQVFGGTFLELFGIGEAEAVGFVEADGVRVLLDGPEEGDRVVCLGEFNELGADALIPEEIIDIQFDNLIALNMDEALDDAVVIKDVDIRQEGSILLREAEDLKLPEGIVVILEDGAELDPLDEDEDLRDAGKVILCGWSDHGFVPPAENVLYMIPRNADKEKREKPGRIRIFFSLNG